MSRNHGLELCWMQWGLKWTQILFQCLCPWLIHSLNIIFDKQSSFKSLTTCWRRINWSVIFSIQVIISHQVTMLCFHHHTVDFFIQCCIYCLQRLCNWVQQFLQAHLIQGLKHPLCCSHTMNYVIKRSLFSYTSPYVWVMTLQKSMGYGYQISVNKVGRHQNVWGLRGYGLIGSWVKRSLTVLLVLLHNNRWAGYKHFPVQLRWP